MERVGTTYGMCVVSLPRYMVWSLKRVAFALNIAILFQFLKSRIGLPVTFWDLRKC